MIQDTGSASMMSDQQLIGLDQAHLLKIEDNSELLGQKFQCHHEVLIPLAKLIRQSEKDGIPLRVVSSYRSFEQQLAIWNRKYYQDILLNLRDGSQVSSQELAGKERVDAILHYSAIPGTSRHHWGTDFDLFDAGAIDQGYQVKLTEQEFSEQGPCANLHQWLEEMMQDYGFFKPYANDLGGVACEPWHLSYQPIAQPALKEFPQQLLRATLEESDLGGKEFVLPRLESLLQKYVYRINQD
ncbi:M15 family metallopeptidase [Kangiella sp. TOML190]|uniref:M15 family metallopeptidase n=1 Tax=Kangiella sp. TOML190 TaxID=2931351 RepID=UPI00203F4B6F|nr:M15 family metallopeptidase [Kangiella sp. TOML190]